MKKYIKKKQAGGNTKQVFIEDPKGNNIGGPNYPSKGMLYNDANRIATSKYFTPDGIRKTDKTLKAGTIGMGADIGLNTELLAKKFMKANNMGKDGLPMKNKSSKKAKTGGPVKMMMGGTKKPKMMMGGAKPKAMYGVSMKPGMMKKGGAKKK